MWTYFRNSNDCFIKSQTVGKSSNWGQWGFRICWICILGWSVLKLGITLWKASIKLSLNILFELQCRKKWCSLSITLQLSHNLCSFGIFLYLPISIFKLYMGFSFIQGGLRPVSLYLGNALIVWQKCCLKITILNILLSVSTLHLNKRFCIGYQ